VSQRTRPLIGGLAAFFFSLLVSLSSWSAEPKEGATPGDFIIGVEDRLTVSVWREQDLTRTVIVRPDGKIGFPLIGDVQAAGRTPRELAADVTAALARFIKEPVVAVMVEEINHFKVFVLGEVHTQGQLVLRQPTRLLQALALAGGLTQYADKSNVVLFRTEEGRASRMRVDYRKLVTGERPELNYDLKPGDTIIVN
jgi:polysaccharide export outer membrane protein